MTRLSGRASGPVPSTSGTTTSFFGSGIEWDPNLSRRTFPSRSTTVSLGTGNVIKAWDRALVGVPRGSRVLVLAPPSLAFQSTGQPPTIPGNATLAYVIDVLGVS